MAFPKSHEILALTSQPELNNRVSANYLTTEILDEALILVRSLSTDEVYRLAKSETSQIAYTLKDYKDDNNRRLASGDVESGQLPLGRINHLDNRVAGVRVQHVDNAAKSALGGTAIFLGAGLWAGLGSSVGSIIGRNAVQFGVTAASAWGTRFVTQKVVAVNQMASHIKNLADMFNTTHNAFSEFRNDVYSKRIQYKPDEDTPPLTFEQNVTGKNALPGDQATAIQQILTRFINSAYQRVDIVGRPAEFIKVYFEGAAPLDISRIQYEYLINLKLP